MGWYLCYFLHRHLEFRVAEFQAPPITLVFYSKL
jgi:hypothetical protein